MQNISISVLMSNRPNWRSLITLKLNGRNCRNFWPNYALLHQRYLIRTKRHYTKFNLSIFKSNVLCSDCAQNAIHVMFNAIEISLAKIRHSKFGNQIKEQIGSK